MYNVGSRQHQVNHARLRLGCSSLNYDLHRRNIIPSSLCACSAISMRGRYGLPCAPTLENLLFGNDRLTPDAIQAFS